MGNCILLITSKEKGKRGERRRGERGVKKKIKKIKKEKKKTCNRGRRDRTEGKKEECSQRDRPWDICKS